MSKLKWTVELYVDDNWVADGFDLTDERAKGMLAKALPYSYNSEIDAKVIGRPAARRVARLQGYPTTKEVIEIRKEGRIKF